MVNVANITAGTFQVLNDVESACFAVRNLDPGTCPGEDFACE